MAVAQFTVLESNSQGELNLEFRKKVELCEIFFFFFFRFVLDGVYVRWPVITQIIVA